MSFDVLIPARFSASRLPGKPLLEIAGKPLIRWVYESARKSSADRVIVATDDERIGQAVLSFGGEICMTRTDHLSGSDRIAEAVTGLGLASDRIVVNVQGDEPQIPGSLINQVAETLVNDGHHKVATACYPVQDVTEFNDPNVVKVVRSLSADALYFSRAPLPFIRDCSTNSNFGWRHIGIYGYRTRFLQEFTSWLPTPLEQTERLEQLRILENGVPIVVCEATELPGPGIDTQEDLEKFRRLVQNG